MLQLKQIIGDTSIHKISRNKFIEYLIFQNKFSIITRANALMSLYSLVARLIGRKVILFGNMISGNVIMRKIDIQSLNVGV